MIPQLKVLAIAALASLSLVSWAAEEPGSTIEVRIPAQPIVDALISLGDQSGLQIVLYADVAGDTESTAVSGEFNNYEEVLSTLLANTGMRYEFINERTVTVVMPSDAASSTPAAVSVFDNDQAANPSSAISGATSDSDSDNRGTDSRAAVVARRENRLEEIITTGTRIPRSNLELPTPVTSASADDIDRAGAIAVSDIVNELPVLSLGQGRTTNNFTRGAQGLTTLNLRGLGTTRTLVLVDGKRHISTDADISTIPASLVERVDIITGGASAIYGADAVAGVVNFVLKDDIDGFHLDSQAGASANGGGEEHSVSATLGSEILDDRGHATVHLTYLKRDAVLASDRSFSRAGSAYVDPQLLGISDSPFSLVSVSNRTTLFDSVSAIATDPGGGAIGSDFYTFTESLAARPFDTGASGVTELFNVIDSELPNLGPGNDRFNVVSPEERTLFNMRASFDPSDNWSLYFDGKYARTKSAGEFSAVGSFFFVDTLQIDNPFIQDDLRALMTNAGLTQIGVNRANAEFGNRQIRTENSTYRALVGATGRIANAYTFDTYYMHGQLDRDYQTINDRFDQRWRQALDVITDPLTGEPVCRNPANGCVPANILGPSGVISPEVIEFVRIPSHTTRESQNQRVYSLTVSGPVGNAQFAAGVEYREESLLVEPSNIHREGLGYFGDTILPIDGSYDVREAFAEITVPLLDDNSAIGGVVVEGAVRVADYSTSGSNTSTRSGFVWKPIQGLSIRGGAARAIRTPNVRELFAPLAENASFISLVNDPCDAAFVNNGSLNRFENCQALGIIDPSAFDGTIGINEVPLSDGGNPNLDVERADTLTIGAILQPGFAPRLSMSIDYYRIDVDDYIEDAAIDTPTIQSVLNGCVDSDSIVNSFCDLIDRAADGRIVGYTGIPINISSFSTSGVDLSIAYGWTLASGDLGVSAVLSHVLERELLLGARDGQAPVSVNDIATELGNPATRATASIVYQTDNWTLNLTQRFLDKQQLDASEANDVRDRRFVRSRWYTDVQLAYSTNDAVTVYAGINNLFSSKVPVHPYTNPIFGPQFGSGMYDAIGQFLYGGLRISL